jgi:hypothetical protein
MKWLQMIKALSTLFVLAFAVCISPASAQQWIEYRPSGEGFRLEMPQAPQVTSRVFQHKIGPLNLVLADVEYPDRSFSVSYFDMPKDKIKNAVKNAESILDGARDGAVRGMTIDGNNAVLRSEQRLNMNGYPGREIVVDIAALNLVSVMRIVLVQNRQYTVGFSGFAGSETQSEVSRFMNSFVILPTQ